MPKAARPCYWCKQVFFPKKKAILFCGKSCSMSQRMQSLRDNGKPHPCWKGGRFIINGYVCVKASKEHPSADKNGYVLEHILIAERALGRRIPVGVQVHHFDEVRSHNEGSNLVICQDAKYHMILHARRRVQQAGASPDTHSICSRCGPRPNKDFCVNNANWHGHDTCCRQCMAGNYQTHIKARRKELQNGR